MATVQNERQMLEELARRERGEGSQLCIPYPMLSLARDDGLVTPMDPTGRTWPRLTAAGRMALMDGGTPPPKEIPR